MAVRFLADPDGPRFWVYGAKRLNQAVLLSRQALILEYIRDALMDLSLYSVLGELKAPALFPLDILYFSAAYLHGSGWECAGVVSCLAAPETETSGWEREAWTLARTRDM